jgi:uncharacterized protein (TIGR03083 family)
VSACRAPIQLYPGKTRPGTNLSGRTLGWMTARTLVADERRDLVSLLRTLSDEEWQAPSLCDGWRVRDVVAHVLYDSIPTRRYLAIMVRGRFSVDRINGRLVDREQETPTPQLVDRLESSIGGGAFARLAPAAALADVLVHHQDIRRPLGRQRSIPEERLVSVLNHPDPFALPWRHTRGMRFVATDVDWSKGRGPEVRGTGEAIALATVGRPVVLDELAGDGVPELRRRLRSRR